MRKKITNKVLQSMMVVLLSLTATNLFSQVPNPGIFFQAVARDNFANPAKDRKIYVQSSIVQSNATGTKVLTEEFQTTTDATGVFSISIGQGTRVGGTVANLANIDWAGGPYFLNLKVSITPTAPTSTWDYKSEWVDLGTTSFGAVPYALYAGTATGLDSKLNSKDTVGMLSVYAKVQAVKTLETTVGTKVASSDTAAMLAPYKKIVNEIIASNITSLTADAINNALDSKVNLVDSNVVYVTPAKLAASAFNPTTINNSLALKANISDINTSLGLKANTTDVTTSLDLKANLTDVTNSLATKVDKVLGKELSSNDYTTAEKTKLAAITGTNTGDQDLSSFATTNNVNTALALKANTTDVNSSLDLKANVTDVTTSLAAKVDKVTGKELSSNDFTNAEKTKLAAITGTNTGDQDLSSFATTSNVNTALALKANTTDVATSLGLKANLISPTFVTPNLGTPIAANLTNATALPLTTGVAGILPIANGGTGLSAVGNTGQVLSTTGSGTLSWTTLPSSVSTVGAIGGASTTNGASISSGVLSLTPADASNGGIVTAGAQTIAGNKTINGSLTVNSITNAAIKDVDNFIGVTGTTGATQWESFVAGTTGILTKITVSGNGNAGARNGTLLIFAGTGIGGSQLSTQTVPLPPVGGAFDLVLTSPVNVVAGQTYTFEILDPLGFSASYGGANTLAGSSYYSNGYGLNPGWGLQFQTWVSTVTGGNISASGTVSGTWDGVTIPVAKGGTGLTSVGTTGQVLSTTAAGTLSWTTLASSVSSIGAIAGSSTANGASISSGVLSLSPADASNGGIITTGSQTISGAKTFVNQIQVGTGTSNSSAAFDIQSTTQGFLPPRMTGAQRDAIVSPATGLMIYCTNCGSNGEWEGYNGVAWTNIIGGSTAAIILKVGDAYQGGIIAYILQSGDPGYDASVQHGLIAATSDQSAGTQWYNGSYLSTGATGTAIGTGSTNTTSIINSQGATTTNYAAGLARAYNGGGYNDWYLPSKDELNKLYLNRVAINCFVAESDYWSSSEQNSSNAWYEHSNGFQNNIYKAFSFLRVRAVRSF